MRIPIYIQNEIESFVKTFFTDHGTSKEKTIATTETNNTSYESTNAQFFFECISLTHDNITFVTLQWRILYDEITV